jgi:peroxiredoxin Q/BCP|tara:strand:+ start:388 stop:732 length:345 start_codon:yes stop_codon:yes gene_type:complete
MFRHCKPLLLGLWLAAIAGPTSALKPGEPAPDFALPGSDGQTHSLADYRGKQAVVLAWFPKAYTSGCTIECKSLAENGHLIREYDVAYFMASVDPLDKNIGFAESVGAERTFPC